jgi:hypothetical protein
MFIRRPPSALAAARSCAGVGSPEELWGLERRDLARTAGVLDIRRVYTQGRLKPCKKSDLQRRRVPLRAKVLEAIELLPTPQRFDGPLFGNHEGDYTRHNTFRLRHWTPALRAAGIEHRSVYACRHTFASWAIRAGVQLFYLSRVMGPLSRRSTRPTATWCPTVTSTCAGYSTATTSQRLTAREPSDRNEFLSPDSARLRRYIYPPGAPAGSRPTPCRLRWSRSAAPFRCG